MADATVLRETLEANRSGHLTPAQRQRHARDLHRTRRTAGILLAATMVAFNVFLAVKGLRGMGALAVVLVELGFLATASVFPLLMWLSTRRLRDDVERGEVVSVEGVIDSIRYAVNVNGLKTGAYFIHIGGKRFFVSDRALVRAAMIDRDRKAPVRLHYLPTSGHLLSIEAVPPAPTSG